MSSAGSPISTPFTKIFISPRVVRLKRRARASLTQFLTTEHAHLPQEAGRLFRVSEICIRVREG